MRLTVLVRVYDRLDDLQVLLEVIRRRWTRTEPRIVVVTNGEGAGHVLPAGVHDAATVVSLPDNAGHREGNSQMLLAGARQIPGDAETVVLLEADTWLLGDGLVEVTAARMARNRWVWAGAEWEERYHSVALDCSVVDGSFLREHPDVLRFGPYPESEVANTITDLGLAYGRIRELMPVHVPKLMRRFHNPFGGRFREFPEGPMVTHHVEDLAGGIDEKKRRANWTAGEAVFEVAGAGDMAAEHARIRRRMAWARRVPRSSWFKAKRRKG